MTLLLGLLFACIVCGLFYWIVSLLPIPSPFKRIAQVACALFLLAWILHAGCSYGFGVLRGFC